MMDPVVDVVIPVHTGLRPIARATASVLRTATVETRVNVICHNVDPDTICVALGDWADDSRVRLLHLDDGLASPGGPINAGLDAATGEFTALLGSDDEYEPGAIDAWVAVARRDRADVVIPPLRTSSGAKTRTPPTRPFRRRNLDGVRDRLAYRTVQLGLVSRHRFGDIRMTAGLRTGEDVIQGASLWYSDARISVARHEPGYLIYEEDPANRTSIRPKPAAESLLFLDAVLVPEFYEKLTESQRESFAVKLLRTHVLDVLALALAAGSNPTDFAAIGDAVRRILEFAPSAIGIVSRRESGILRELLGAADSGRLAAEHAARFDYRRPSNLIPASLGKMLHREAPLRFLAAIALTP
jgi:hypothetical protein